MPETVSPCSTAAACVSSLLVASAHAAARRPQPAGFRLSGCLVSVLAGARSHLQRFGCGGGKLKEWIGPRRADASSPAAMHQYPDGGGPAGSAAGFVLKGIHAGAGAAHLLLSLVRFAGACAPLTLPVGGCRHAGVISPAQLLIRWPWRAAGSWWAVNLLIGLAPWCGAAGPHPHPG